MNKEFRQHMYTAASSTLKLLKAIDAKLDEMIAKLDNKKEDK